MGCKKNESRNSVGGLFDHKDTKIPKNTKVKNIFSQESY